MIALHKPRLYIEIGSGNSTKFAARAIRDHHLATTIVSIDPNPRAEIDQLSHRAILQPLETADLGIMEKLRAGDILFMDGSHRVFMNSDVTWNHPELRPIVQGMWNQVSIPGIEQHGGSFWMEMT